MNVRSAHAAYRQGQVGSAGPLQLVVLLYEGAIRFARRAQEAFDDPAVRGESLGRCHAIVTELLASPDRDRGGDVASNLDRLYRYVLEALTEANVDLDRGAHTGYRPARSGVAAFVSKAV